MLLAITGLIFYYKLAIPNRRQSSKEKIEICRKLIQERKAYPSMCRQVVKIGMCACLPCEKLNKAKKDDFRK